MFRKIVCIVLIISSSVSFAQRIKIDRKKLSFLKSESRIEVQLTFPEQMTFLSDNMSEKEFILYMKERRSKKDPSMGDKWLVEYNNAKQTTWKTDFLSTINKALAGYSDLRFVDSEEKTNYLLIVEGNWMYPGYGGGASVGREEAKLEVTLKFVDKSTPENVLYMTQTPKIIGNYAYGEFGTILRVGECYKKLGYLLNLQLKRILK
ncbi:hypothetical protein SAMN04487910_3540 [Aquimarina amphilecti]|uniref:GLPGLI family protein n=1 Tax=Aquimarina amphilecti TaxID=1038014 RepID=A0A1H7TPJ4_AQUAM|nr:hypothetical protein [Aquimarina amphilecti]SEL86770.1 hypothetical protein SAMN04487910_3540 [Aquimarina amphilecti]